VLQKNPWREQQGLAVFQYPDGKGGKVNFQTTRNGACGSKYAARRIARACYLKFECGESKESVLEFRSACYSRLQDVTGVERLQDASGAEQLQDAREGKQSTSWTQKLVAAAGDSDAGPTNKHVTSPKQTLDPAAGEADARPAKQRKLATPARSANAVKSKTLSMLFGTPEARATDGQASGASETAASEALLAGVTEAASEDHPEGTLDAEISMAQASGHGQIHKESDSSGLDYMQCVADGLAPCDVAVLQITKDLFPACWLSAQEDGSRALELCSLNAKAVLRVLPKQAKSPEVLLQAFRHLLESLAAARQRVGNSSLQDGTQATGADETEHKEADQAEDEPQGARGDKTDHRQTQQSNSLDQAEGLLLAESEPHSLVEGGEASQPSPTTRLMANEPCKMSLKPMAEIFSEVAAAGPENEAGAKDKELLPRVLATFSRYLTETLAASTKQLTRDNYILTLFKTFARSGLSLDALAQPSLGTHLAQSEEHKKSHGCTTVALRRFSNFWREAGGYDAQFDDADRDSIILSLGIKPVLVDAAGLCGAGAHAGCLCTRPKQRCETCGLEMRCARHEDIKHTTADCREIFWAKHSPDGKRSRTIADFMKPRAANVQMDE